ncbi:hypothetical protein KUTeg_012286 [Tegillarca granosa]|uniref:Integrase catalytic domain-containing protein n=1 Tax=Tegillarca granosa TaxID=220873 RepID=A0ABQ9F2J4_TEGGR|nr:hypothetical protein KUTeg_012286 [Tegillarca granosa]
MDVTEQFPLCGESILGQMLKKQGIHVPHERGLHTRKKGRLKRRIYDVKGPNHIWHVDTNHKLIRWNFIVAGGIDGFSRLITYLFCLDNNKSETVLECFRHGISRFGLPQRVRSDKGLENVGIADFMIANRGSGRGSKLTGKSVHNQRIERLWRDVYTGVLAFYYTLFYHMEDEGVLDPLDEVHIAALHYTYLPIINEKLEIWKEAWASHRMRTTKSSPRVLWLSGQMQNPTGLEYVDRNYGIEGFGVENNDAEQDEPVINSVSEEIITDACRRQLDEEVLNFSIDNNFGIPLYKRVLQIIKNHTKLHFKLTKQFEISKAFFKGKCA